MSLKNMYARKPDRPLTGVACADQGVDDRVADADVSRLSLTCPSVETARCKCRETKC